jgi:hypothetical protein
MAKKDLIWGQNWRRAIPMAVRDADVVIVCLSHIFNRKAGFGQDEIKLALETARQQPDDHILIIPLRDDGTTRWFFRYRYNDNERNHQRKETNR